MSTLKELKSSFFGFNKAGVCAYIANMNEEFSQKMIEKDAAHAEEVRALRQRVEALEAENLELVKMQKHISDTLIDAKTFAAELQAKAAAEDKQMREENAARNNAERERINRFGEGIDVIRDDIQGLLRKLDADLEKQREKMEQMLTENEIPKEQDANCGKTEAGDGQS